MKPSLVALCEQLLRESAEAGGVDIDVLGEAITALDVSAAEIENLAVTWSSDKPAVPPFVVEVTRSKRRKRSVGAQLVGSTLRLAIPAWMSRAEEAHWVDEMSRRFSRRMSTERFDLARRAAELARQAFDAQAKKLEAQVEKTREARKAYIAQTNDHDSGVWLD